MSKLYLLFWVFFCVAVSCREVLINSADAEKEKLLVGIWTLQGQDPPLLDSLQTIQLSFTDTLTVQIYNTATDSADNYRYHVEDGTLFFLKRTAEGDAVQFFYTIVDLTLVYMVLEFSDNDNRIRQYYTRSL